MTSAALDYDLYEADRAPGSDDDVLSEDDAAFVQRLIMPILAFTDELAGHSLYPYERELAQRIVESILINDGAELTALFSRQSGKTETVANVTAALVVLLPKLAKAYPARLGQFSRGFWVGCFAPVIDQAETLFHRIRERLTSERATEIMSDVEIDDQADTGTRVITLKSGSLVRVQSANPKASIESKTYHLVIIDEAQRADSKVVRKSISPMLASTNGTIVKTGTPDYVKGDFYEAIQRNRNGQTARRGAKQNHFQYDWKVVSKYNPRYGQFVTKQRERLGEDSDEFQLAYGLKWILERGLFIIESQFERLSDPTMSPVKAWRRSPIVLGVDPARKIDSTVVTAVWVDWDRPDEFGFFDHRVLNWLELRGDRWEEQYGRILEFAESYLVKYVVVDVQGVGDAVADRLERLMPYAEITQCGSNVGEQARRWKHLQELIQRGRVMWPGSAKARRGRTWQRFASQMTNLEKVFTGAHMVAAAPGGSDSHDDYADSLALACYATKSMQMPWVEVSENPFFSRR